MKSFLLLFALSLLAGSPAFADTPAASSLFRSNFDDTTRFIFYSVLEGCYEDGLSNKDIDQILLRADNGKGGRLHFIYACPICGTTVGALETYRVRPRIPLILSLELPLLAPVYPTPSRNGSSAPTRVSASVSSTNWSRPSSSGA